MGRMVRRSISAASLGSKSMEGRVKGLLVGSWSPIPPWNWDLIAWSCEETIPSILASV